MTLSLTVVYGIFYIFSVFFIVAVSALIVHYFKNKKKEKRHKQIRDFLINRLEGKVNFEKSKRFFKKNENFVISEYIKLKQANQLTSGIEQSFGKLADELKIKDKLVKKTKSFRRTKRVSAYVFLGYFPGEKTRTTLKKALKKEDKFSTKLYILNSLAVIGDKRSIKPMVDSLKGTPSWYQKKARVLISEFGEKFLDYLPELIEKEEKEIQRLIIYFSKEYSNLRLKKYLIEKTGSRDEEIAIESMEALRQMYPEELNSDKFLYSVDPQKRRIAIEALGEIPEKGTIDKLISMHRDSFNYKYLVSAIASICETFPGFINYLYEIYSKEMKSEIKNIILDVFSGKVEYFILKTFNNDPKSKSVLSDLLSKGKISGIIGFLNRNKNKELENNILSIIKKELESPNSIEQELSYYLSADILKKIHLEKSQPPAPNKEETTGKTKRRNLLIILTALILAFPLAHFLRYFDVLSVLSLKEHLTRYVVDFNYYLAYYVIAVNASYLILLFFSFLGVFKQKSLWDIKNYTLFFKKDILPSISIIAPAYNEESNIIESINSLLNLRYPDYELIVVNDGSKDKTLNRLIDYYDLEKVDKVIEEKINTQPVRGVYRNDRIKSLTVIDKANGGKADALNVGINTASKRFFCGIDADSLLETDALLKIASPLLDSDVETVAVGGNIFPVNGCDIDKGELEKLALPENPLAKFQTIEYLRAYMAGRVGWSYINALLIISGAFGFFSRKRVIEAGGYLSSSGKYHKDTVGEDMELVVRLARLMVENGKKFNIEYAFNANCWTEVPEKFKGLYTQRDRWQRGLIDILEFHKKLIFNPRYRETGLISLPYFTVFECLGPIVELQGYLMVVLAAVLGLLNSQILLLLFASTILMGGMVSISSLIISLKQYPYFNLKDMSIMMFYAIVENFGFRQMVSIWRAVGFLNSLKKKQGWGKIIRRGFNTEKLNET